MGLLRPGGKFELAAVSGKTFVDEKLPETKALRDSRMGIGSAGRNLRRTGGGRQHRLAASRNAEKFRAYFEMTGSLQLPCRALADGDGRVGLFAMESKEPYGFGEQAMRRPGCSRCRRRAPSAMPCSISRFPWPG